jgi:zeaxanthin glucosyltransferase
MKIGVMSPFVPGHLNSMTTLARQLQSHWLPQFHYSGPFHDGMARAKVDFPPAQLTAELMVYASIGTVANGRLEIFRTIVSAVAKLKNVQLVLAIESQRGPEQIGPAPSNAIVVKQAPQLELLKQSSVCITHAGSAGCGRKTAALG